MNRSVAALASTVVLTVALGVGGAWAEGKVAITREESRPKRIEVKVEEEVRFINSSASIRGRPVRGASS